MNPILSAALAKHRGVLTRAAHRTLTNLIDVALRRGDLTAPFRGVYTEPAPDHATRLRALAEADPDAVATGPSAEHLHGWTETPPETVTAASTLASRPGFELTRRTIPRWLTTRANGVRYTSRALTAIDLATERGVEEVDAALDVAERIAAQAPLAVQASLANARLAQLDPRSAAGRLHPVVAMLAGTEDARRAVTGYLSGTPVSFEGR